MILALEPRRTGGPNWRPLRSARHSPLDTVFLGEPAVAMGDPVDRPSDLNGRRAFRGLWVGRRCGARPAGGTLGATPDSTSVAAAGVRRRYPARDPRPTPQFLSPGQTLDFGFAATPATNPHRTGNPASGHGSVPSILNGQCAGSPPDEFLGRVLPQEKKDAGRQHGRLSLLRVAQLNPNGCLAG